MAASELTFRRRENPQKMFAILWASCDIQSAASQIQRPNYEGKNLIATRLGVLQCRAKAQTRKRSGKAAKATTTVYRDDHNDQEELAENSEGEAPKSSRSPQHEAQQHQGPNVIILPPIEAAPTHIGSNDEEDGDGEDSAGEESGATEDGPEGLSRSKSAGKRRSSGGGSDWGAGRHRTRSWRALARHRRQATEAGSADPIEEAARELLGLRPRPRLIAPELVRHLLGSLLMMVQQLISLLVGQSAADLGRLVANIMAALTVDNPLLANSPLLRQSQRQTSSPAVGGAGVEWNLAAEQNSSRAGETLDAANRLLRTLNGQWHQKHGHHRGSATSSSDTGGEHGGNGPPETATKPASSSNNPIGSNEIRSNMTGLTEGSRTRDSGEREAEEDTMRSFVNRLSELTSSSLVEAGVRPLARRSSQSSEVEKRMGRPQRRLSRRKRSIANLLLLGPFSKFYMAMMMNKMMKYQTSVVSQAITGELVRRFLVPALTSALLPGASGGVGSQLPLTSGLGNTLNQMRQTLMGAVAGQPLSGNQVLLPPGPPGAPFKAQRLTGNGRDPSGTAEEPSAPSFLFDADCRLVNNDTDQSAIDSSSSSAAPSVSPLFAGAGGSIGSANLEAANSLEPVLSLDQGGLHFNAPNSALRYTIPNLFGGQHNQLGLQAALRQTISELTQPPSQQSLRASQHPQALRYMPGFPHPPPPGQHNQAGGRERLQVHQHQVNRGPGRPKLPASPYDWSEHQGLANGSSPAPVGAGDDKTLPGAEGRAIWPAQQAPAAMEPSLEDGKTLLNELVARATPDQLVALLAQMMSSIQSSPGVGASIATDLLDQTKFNQTPAMREFEGIISQVEQPQFGLQQGKTNDEVERIAAKSHRQGSAVLPVDELAESILNKTLGMHAGRLAPSGAPRATSSQPRDHSKADDEKQLIRETSKLLASSFAQLVRGLDFGGSSNHVSPEQNSSKSMNPPGQLNVISSGGRDVQITLSPEKVAKLMDKLSAPPSSSVLPPSEHNQAAEDLQRYKPSLSQALGDQSQSTTALASGGKRQLPATAPNPTPAPSGPAAKPVTAKQATFGPERPVRPEVATQRTTIAPQKSRPPDQEIATTAASGLAAVGAPKDAPTKQPEAAAATAAAAGQQQPLNNLAMALNVMNMVLLNQQLANSPPTPKPNVTLAVLGSLIRQAIPEPVTKGPTSHPELGPPRRRFRPINGGRPGKLYRKKFPGPTSAAGHSTKTATTTTVKAAGSELERESNHRTSKSRLRPNATLLVDAAAAAASRKLHANYHYQPIPVSQPPLASGGQAADPASDKKQDNNDPSSSEQDEHASRWNDVLQHISLAAS